MSKISELTEDLVEKISTISSLNDRVGTNVGGTEIDPYVIDGETPFCWVVFDGDGTNDTEKRGYGSQRIIYTFAVAVVLEYSDQTHMLQTNYPLLESIIAGIRNTTPNINGINSSWIYDGQRLVGTIPQKGRIIYEQYYSIFGFI